MEEAMCVLVLQKLKHIFKHIDENKLVKVIFPEAVFRIYAMALNIPPSEIFDKYITKVQQQELKQQLETWRNRKQPRKRKAKQAKRNAKRSKTSTTDVKIKLHNRC